MDAGVGEAEDNVVAVRATLVLGLLLQVLECLLRRVEGA